MEDEIKGKRLFEKATDAYNNQNYEEVN
jgi:hypothetical protein